MATRIIREGFLTSEPVNDCSDAAQNLFIRLMLVADDFGYYYGNPEIIKSMCYPIRSKPLTIVSKLLTELEHSGLISTYTVDGKQFVEIKKFGQRLRAMRPKFPPPQSAAECGNRPPESESELETKRSRKEVESETEGLPPNAAASAAKTWRSDFETYETECVKAFENAVADTAWMELRAKYHPTLDIRLSLEKAMNDFWATEAGWMHKKKKKTQDINWRSTMEKALSLPSNQVRKPYVKAAFAGK